MKKIASCLLALALLVTLTACSGKSDNLSDGTDTSGTVSDTVKDTEKGTETAPAETTGESDTAGAETGTEQPTSDSKATAPAKDTTSAANPPATNPPTTNPPATNPPTTPPTTVKTCNHSNTEVRNKKDATTSSEGYTGDTYCKDCGKLISSGSSIPKIKQTYTATHDYYDIEMEIFRLINEERAKNGLPAYVWDEELYPGTKVRVNEINNTWGHTRPNGNSFITAIIENSNYTMASFQYWGENIAESCGYSSASDVAKDLFTEWYNSQGHRANMLDTSFNCVAIAVANIGYEDYIADNIFIGK